MFAQLVPSVEALPGLLPLLATFARPATNNKESRVCRHAEPENTGTAACARLVRKALSLSPVQQLARNVPMDIQRQKKAVLTAMPVKKGMSGWTDFVSNNMN